MNSPNFFIVGAPKCGTSALHRALAQHPDVYLPDSDDPERYWLVKEPNFFCGDLGIADWLRVKEEVEYLGLFGRAGTAKRIGEASPWYLFSEEAPKRIRSFAGTEVKIVILLRSPVEWMRSWHHDLLRYDYEDLVDFEEALEAEIDREWGRQMPARGAYPGCLCFRRAARFSEQVKRYVDYFGEEQVFVGLLEDMEEDSGALLRQICRFLGVRSDLGLTIPRVNVAPMLPATHAFDSKVGRAMNRLPGGKVLAKGFSETVGRPYRRIVDRVAGPLSDKSIEPRLEAELKEEFLPEVERLAKVIGRDLSHWHELSPEALNVD
ncbi:MAG: sulfotransferase [Verrucomicrobiota bacterium]